MERPHSDACLSNLSVKLIAFLQRQKDFSPSGVTLLDTSNKKKTPAPTSLPSRRWMQTMMMIDLLSIDGLEMTTKKWDASLIPTTVLYDSCTVQRQQLL